MKIFLFAGKRKVRNQSNSMESESRLNELFSPAKINFNNEIFAHRNKFPNTKIVKFICRKFSREIIII